METTSKKSAPKIAVNTAARLDAARIAIDRLKKEKLSESDRIVLARNLGTLFQKCRDITPSLSLWQIFIETFGMASGESQYKKRKRLVILPEENEVSEKLAQKGRQYRELAIRLSEYIELPENEPKSSAVMLSILRLIEGSSYDLSTAHRDRFNQEYQVEIDSKLRRLTERVVESVDLDWMRTWSEMHTVPIIGKTGDVSRISLRKETFSERVRHDVSNLNLDGEITCCLAPCVRLGTITSRLPMRRYIDVQIESYENEEKTRDFILDALTEMLQSETPLKDMEDEDIGYALKECDLWCDFSADEDLHSWNSYEVSRNLDLELRYEGSSNKWYSCILSRYSTTDSFFTHSSLPELLPAIEIISVCYEVGKVFASKKRGPNQYRIFSIDGANYIGSHSQYMGFGTGIDIENKSSWSAGKFRETDDQDGVHALDERFFSTLLQSNSEDLESCYFKPLIDNWHDKRESEHDFFVKAPNGSLAYYILKNLAYAPIEERVDQILIKDAKNKYAMLKEYSLRVAKEYEEAISRF